MASKSILVDLDFGSSAKAIGLPAPSASTDAANKNYVDTLTINTQSGTTYTFVLTDISAVVAATNAGTKTFTIPLNSSVAFPAGSSLYVRTDSGGTTTISYGSGITINGVAGPATFTVPVGQIAAIQNRAADVWVANVSSAPGGGSGDVVGPASAVDNAIARFDTTTGKLIQNSVVSIDDSGQVTLPYDATPTTPAVGNTSLLATKLAGYFDVPGFIGPDGFLHGIEPDNAEFTTVRFQPQPNSTTPTGDNSMPVIATGSGTAASIATTNFHQMKARLEVLVTTAATTAVAGLRGSTNLVRIGRSAAAPGGFMARILWGPATGVATTTNRGFAGLLSVAAPTDVEPSTILNCVGMGWDAADTNIQMMHNDGSGVCTKIDLGASFPVSTVDRTDMYELQLYSPNSLTQEVRYRVIKYNTTGKTIAAEATGTINTNIPAVTQLLGLRCNMSVGGTSSVIGVSIMGFYLGTVY